MTTRERIKNIEDRIAELEDMLKRTWEHDVFDDVDIHMELLDLREELNFAWQDDEQEADEMREWNQMKWEAGIYD